jgi:hypothetical protein
MRDDGRRHRAFETHLIAIIFFATARPSTSIR